MIEAKHTPGPWKVFEHECSIIPIMAGRRHICSVSGPFTMVEDGVSYNLDGTANARLIAAAPELLEALENCVINWSSLGGGSEPWLIHARSVIERAKEGEE